MSMGFSSKNTRVSCLPDPGIKPASLTSLALAAQFFTTGATCYTLVLIKKKKKKLSIAMFLNFYPSSLFYFELTPVTGEGNGNPLRILAWRILWTEEPGGL